MNRSIEAIPTWSLCYIINGDASGLTDEEIRMVDEAMRKNNIEIVSPRYNEDMCTEPYFSHYPFFGLPTEVEDCDIIYHEQCRYGHVRHFIDHPRHLETCWNAYKIANRNHYLITDIGKWADYICMLVEMGKDIRSPHYICPDNLEAEHDRISEKIRAKKEKERTEEEIRKALKNEDKFKEMKSRFFGLMFTDGNIVVRMLESVREHVLEGKAMHHCVGSGTNYSLNPDCIIFSARIAEQRVETVEFSLEQMKVVQCHGLQNKDTEHHADIINLVNSNARLIEQRMVATT